MDKPEFKWVDRPEAERPIQVGDVRIVTLPVEVFFTWSDKIVADYDEETGHTEYTSGFVMHVSPQRIIYTGQPSQFLCCQMRENEQKEEKREV